MLGRASRRYFHSPKEALPLRGQSGQCEKTLLVCIATERLARYRVILEYIDPVHEL